MKYTFFSLLILSTTLTFAQSRKKASYSSDNSLQQGNVVISAGYGVGNFSSSFFDFVADATGVDGFDLKTSGPFFLKGEYAVTDNIGLGLNVATITNKSTEFSFTFTDPTTQQQRTAKASFKRPNTSVMLRGNFYFVNQESFQMYAGLGLGFRAGGFKISGEVDEFNRKFSIPFANPFGFETTIGGRYFFIPNLGVYTEFGGAKGLLQFGLSGKF